MKKCLNRTILLLTSVLVSTGFAQTYYIHPDKGSDTSNDGLTEDTPWKTFTKAWSVLTAGDTLILLNGTYRESLTPTTQTVGAPGAPITFRAKEDGQAVVDGEYTRDLLNLEDWITGNENAYYTFEGMNFKNSGINIALNHVTLRRVHIYNEFMPKHDPQGSNPPGGYGSPWPVHIGRGNGALQTGVLLEDCIISGHGTKTIKIFRGSATVRRTYVEWRWFNGFYDGNLWPWSGDVNIYHARDTIIENVVASGINPSYAFNMHGNELEPPADAVENNQYLGCISLNVGQVVNAPGAAPIFYAWDKISQRPQPSVGTGVVDYLGWRGWREGMSMGGGVKSTRIKDILVTGSAGLGFDRSHCDLSACQADTPPEQPCAPRDCPISSDNTIERITLYGNSLVPNMFDGPDAEANFDDFTASDSFVEGTADNGGGADIRFEYIDSVLHPELPLWPWPMEERVRRELGISVTNRVAAAVALAPAGAAVKDSVQPIPNNLPILLVTPNVLPFVNTAPGNSQSLVLTISNPGDAPLALANSLMVNDQAESVFTITDTTCASTLDPGASCVATVGFQPIQTDVTYSGRLAVFPGNMGVNHPEIISLVGKGDANAQPDNTPPAAPTGLQVRAP